MTRLEDLRTLLQHTITGLRCEREFDSGDEMRERKGKERSNSSLFTFLPRLLSSRKYRQNGGVTIHEMRSNFTSSRLHYSERAIEHWRSLFFFQQLMDNGSAVSSVDYRNGLDGWMGGSSGSFLFSVHTLLGMDILTKQSCRECE
jgi:hypothetical protein